MKKKFKKEQIDKFERIIKEKGRVREEKYKEDINKSKDRINALRNFKKWELNRNKKETTEDYLASKSKINKKVIIDRQIRNENKINKHYGNLIRKEKIRKLGTNVKRVTSKVGTAARVGLNKFGETARKYATVKMVNKRILKPNKMSVKIEEYKAPSVLGDENRFFKSEYDKEKRSLFFS